MAYNAGAYIDRRSIMHVLGSILKKTEILNRADKYVFHPEDFYEDFYILVFGMTQHLKEQGLENISFLDIENYLSNRPGAQQIFMKNKGFEYISSIIELADVSKFDYYYERLKKIATLRYFSSYGIDVTWLYDPTTLDIKLKQKQEDWLDNTSILEIVEAIQNKIDEVRSKVFNPSGEDSVMAGDGIDELISRLQETPEVGIPLYGPLINTITRGARLKKFYLRSAPTGFGKAIPNDTIIPTPDGDRRVDEIKAGDWIFGENGDPVKVLKTHPQKTSKQVFKIGLEDGRIAYSCEDHLWTVFDNKRTQKLVDTKFLFKEFQEIMHGDFYLPRAKAVEYKEQEQKIPAYLFAMLFSLYIQLSTDYQKESVKQMFYERLYLIREDHYGLYKINSLTTIDLENLYNQLEKGNGNIPFNYLFGSIEQRQLFLQGVFDYYSGSANPIRINCPSESFYKNIRYMLLSLGYDVKDVPLNDRYSKLFFGRLSVNGPLSEILNLFNLAYRKNEVLDSFQDKNNIVVFSSYVKIVSVEKLNSFAEMTCFTVDNPSHLFLMNDFIVTHNTRMMVADACNFACNEIYDINKRKWVPNGATEPTLYITTEQELDEIQTMMLAFLSGVEEDKILNGRYLQDEEDRVRYAAKVLKTSPLWVEELHNFSLNDIENVMRKNIIDNKVNYICFDYIHTSMKIIEEISMRIGGVKLREDHILYMLSIRLKDLCNELGVFIISGTQLSAEWEGKKDGNQNLLRGAKSLADKVDFGAVVLPVTEDDIQALQPLLAQNAGLKLNMVYHIYKNRRGKYSSVKLWCNGDLDTCRVTPIFLTDNNYQLLPIEDFQISIIKD